MTRIIRAKDRAAAADRPAPAGRRGTRVVRAAEQAARREAEALLARTRAQVEAMLEQARQQAQQLREEQIAQGQAEATRLLLATRRRCAALLQRAERDLTELGLRIGEKLLGRQLQLHPDTVADIVSETLRSATGGQRAVVRINPSDRPALQQHLAELQRAAAVGTLVLENDATVSAGGCVVETEAGQIDGRLEHQLSAIRAALSQDAEDKDEQAEGDEPCPTA